MVNLFRDKSNKIPWKLKNRRVRALIFAYQIRVVVSHIHQEGNEVANKLTNTVISGFICWWTLAPSYTEILLGSCIIASATSFGSSTLLSFLKIFPFGFFFWFSLLTCRYYMRQDRQECLSKKTLTLPIFLNRQTHSSAR